MAPVKNICSVLLSRKYASWSDLESQIERLQDTTEKGDAFEQFCYFYFCFYSALYQISSIFTPKINGKEIPHNLRTKYKLSKKDDGVDGLFITTDGKATVYQAKFRSGRKSPPSNELNNFWAEGEYADYRLVIANATSLPADVQKRKNNLSVLVNAFDDLPADFFDFLYDSANELQRDFSATLAPAKKFRPRDYQKPIIKAAKDGFKKHDRGKIIAACGTGKTLLSLWISETVKSDTILFMAPNLALIRQTIASWTRHSQTPFVYLAVCSDQTVQSGIPDEFTVDLSSIDIPVTTEADAISEFLKHKTDKKKIVFSTYQSIDCVIQAVHKIKGFVFDFAVYDEAHRTAGTGSTLFSHALSNNLLPVGKRLFMTATERLIRPWVKDKLEQENRIFFSMDDEELFGPVFYRLPFGVAIRQGIIADYRIVVAAMTDDELQAIIASDPLVTAKDSKETIAQDVAAKLLFKAALFSKVMAQFHATKAISFHSSVPLAKKFISIVEKIPGIPEDRFLGHVNGTFSASERSEVFRQFETSPFSLMTNVRCLTEGVDIPFIDAVMFVDPRGSLIDIVQAVGRALRKPFGVSQKTSNIIVPVLLDSKTGEPVDDAFNTLHAVIQALRDQDEMLADWIDQVNLGVVTGRERPLSGGKVQVVLPGSINIDDFMNNLAVRISIANSKPTGSVGLGSTLGKTQRGSDFERVFKTICDYNVEALKSSLIDPTVNKWALKQLSASKQRASILINNNNISHTERIGLIKKDPAHRGSYLLTPLGEQYRSGEIAFERLFKYQVLLWSNRVSDKDFYPYRLAFEVLGQVNTLNYIEFLYGLYLISSEASAEDAVAQAVARIQYIRQTFPNVMLTAPGNREQVRQALNSQFGVSFSERDVWTDRTTTGNQLRFFLNHISLFTDCFVINLKSKLISQSNYGSIQGKLEKTKKVLENKSWFYGNKL